MIVVGSPIGTSYCFGDGTGTMSVLAESGFRSAVGAVARTDLAGGANSGSTAILPCRPTRSIRGTGMPDSSCLYFKARRA
jgi:hypothetical protein